MKNVLLVTAMVLAVFASTAMAQGYPLDELNLAIEDRIGELKALDDLTKMEKKELKALQKAEKAFGKWSDVVGGPEDVGSKTLKHLAKVLAALESSETGDADILLWWVTQPAITDTFNEYDGQVWKDIDSLDDGLTDKQQAKFDKAVAKVGEIYDQVSDYFKADDLAKAYKLWLKAIKKSEKILKQLEKLI